MNCVGTTVYILQGVPDIHMQLRPAPVATHRITTPKVDSMNTEFSSTRVHEQQERLKALLTQVELRPSAMSIVEARLSDHWVDLDEALDKLQVHFNRLAFKMLVASAVAVICLLISNAEISGSGILSTMVKSAALLASARICALVYWLCSIQQELWLHEPISRLGLGTELLGIASWSPSAFAYVKIAGELYFEHRGVDMVIARKLAIAERSALCKSGTDWIEVEAIRKLGEIAGQQ